MMEHGANTFIEVMEMEDGESSGNRRKIESWHLNRPCRLVMQEPQCHRQRWSSEGIHWLYCNHLLMKGDTTTTTVIKCACHDHDTLSPSLSPWEDSLSLMVDGSQGFCSGHLHQQYKDFIVWWHFNWSYSFIFRVDVLVNQLLFLFFHSLDTIYPRRSSQ